jgi:hypothetical protein
MLRQHLAGTRSWHEYLWTLLMLELWHRTFIDEASPAVRQRPTVLAGLSC